MNCRRFQYDLYEYLDGSLSPGAQTAAEKHLAECADCRQRLAQERRMAHSLGERFRQATAHLELPISVRRRVLAALAEEGGAAKEEPGTVLLWRRWAWPLALAASVLLLGVGVLLLRGPGLGGVPPQPRAGERVVSVQLTYVVPVYTFHQERGLVIDALTCQTNVINERLQTELASLK